MASPAFSFCAAVENSVQMLFIEIETDPYTATRLAGNDLEICKLTYGTRKELFQIRLRDIPDLLAVIINADELKRNIVAICVEPLSALATVAGDLSTNGLGFLAFGSLGLPAGG